MTENIFVETTKFNKIGIVQTNLYNTSQGVTAMSHNSQMQRRGIFVGSKFKEIKTKVVQQNIEHLIKVSYLIV